MFSRIHQRLGTAGLIVAVVALVAALAGGAYAANGGLNKQQKKQVRNIAKNESKKWSKKFSKRFAKQGPQGDKGDTGATGATGATGPKGATGSPGEPGEDGEDGAPGTSAEATGYAGSECAEASGEEGIEVTSAGSPQYVCNGKDGEDGETGFTETLPSGQTETGDWSMPAATITELLESKVPLPTISFTIPLAEELTGPQTHYVPVGGSEVKAEGEGDLTSGSNVVENVSTESGEFKAGYYIEGTGIKAGTMITEVISATELKLSANATATEAEVSLTAKGAPTACENSGHEGVANAANPEASAGNLCYYAGVGSVESDSLTAYKGTMASAAGSAGAATTGAILAPGGEVTAGDYLEGEVPTFGGTWAVTAP
jgi:hypothetical protein